MTVEPTGSRSKFVGALAARLAKIDIDRVLDSPATVESLVCHMIASLPDVFAAEPPAGACYTSNCLENWRGQLGKPSFVTIVQAKSWVSSLVACFSFRRPSSARNGLAVPALNELLAKGVRPLTSAEDVARWLRPPFNTACLTPETLHAISRSTDAAESRAGAPARNQLTVIDPAIHLVELGRPQRGSGDGGISGD